ncbi:hypothetical protein BACCAP_03580 [Pseudoflavonifractor capillosus ATCC 29799]|uniref:Uncharacterized protein n=1 Tax=Pseudoflavonifractor capillosus ATCC 29799 TaxID=411467 RepID=A6NZC9_9FIRM|nr:hypothetical protein BACCAP_03580 [Pseudoflavonifractor capillosus ATCC 29799]
MKFRNYICFFDKKTISSFLYDDFLDILPISFYHKYT